MLLASCATSRTTSTLQEATLQEAHQSERAEEVAAATLDEQRHNVQQTQTDVLTTKQLFAEPIPSEQTSLEIPTQNLLNLPEGAKYGTHSGRASVEAERRGDNIVVTGKCDSIARRCVYFESQVFRQREVIDSLAQLLIAERAKYRQLDSLRQRTVGNHAGGPDNPEVSGDMALVAPVRVPRGWNRSVAANQNEPAENDCSTH